MISSAVFFWSVLVSHYHDCNLSSFVSDLILISSPSHLNPLPPPSQPQAHTCGTPRCSGGGALLIIANTQLWRSNSSFNAERPHLVTPSLIIVSKDGSNGTCCNNVDMHDSSTLHTPTEVQEHRMSYKIGTDLQQTIYYNYLTDTDLKRKNVITAANAIIYPGLGVEARRTVSRILLGCHVVVRESLFQWRDRVDRSHPAV